MNKKLTYQLLENQMVKYKDLKEIKIKDCKEPLVPLNRVKYKYIKEFNDMEKISKGKILVRRQVREKIISAQKLLKKIKPSWELLITYGYRTPKIQKKYFNQVFRKIKGKIKNKNLIYEIVHRQIAVPQVAGHPTGGAIDLTIIKNNKMINIGTKIYDFSSKDIYTFSPFISKEAQKNRLLLRLIMLEMGFAPFDGEWWHFSYGDKEWAFYYQKSFAIYGEISYNQFKDCST